MLSAVSLILIHEHTLDLDNRRCVLNRLYVLALLGSLLLACHTKLQYMAAAGRR